VEIEPEFLENNSPWVSCFINWYLVIGEIGRQIRPVLSNN